MNDRTLGRFRERCSTYEKKHDTIVSLSGEMAEVMKLDLSLKRKDSLMVSSNIKKMSCLELLYTCVANLVKEAAEHKEELPEELRHYIQADDRNRVIYHNRREETADKIAVILKDAVTLKELCGCHLPRESREAEPGVCGKCGRSSGRRRQYSHGLPV